MDSRVARGRARLCTARIIYEFSHVDVANFLSVCIVFLFSCYSALTARPFPLRLQTFPPHLSLRQPHAQVDSWLFWSISVVLLKPCVSPYSIFCIDKAVFAYQVDQRPYLMHGTKWVSTDDGWPMTSATFGPELLAPQLMMRPVSGFQAATFSKSSNLFAHN